jgi:predicted methyltransferase
MKRNKRTITLGHDDLTPLTEHILAQMGDEGVDIRERLKKFYRRRYLKNPLNFQENLDQTA